jgi:hypothetical protein
MVGQLGMPVGRAGEVSTRRAAVLLGGQRQRAGGYSSHFRRGMSVWMRGNHADTCTSAVTQIADRPLFTNQA